MARKRKRADIKLLDNLTDGFTGFVPAVKQIVENASDWRIPDTTPVITLRFYTDRKGKEVGVPCLDFIDNGRGMGERGREAYTIAAGSLARDDENMIGTKGTGRVGFIHHADASVAVEKASDDRAHTITLTRENLYEYWFNNGKPLNWRTIDLPYGHPIKSSGTVITWRNLGHGDPRKLAARKPAVIIDKLGDELAPNIARCVTVEIVHEDGKVERHPLKKRALRGKAIEGQDLNIPVLGDVEYEIYVVEKTDRGIGSLEIGGMTPACTFVEFASALIKDPRYAEMARPINSVLSHGAVLGLILFKKLKGYALNARKGIDARLLEDEDLVHALLLYLRRKIVKLVEDELGMRSTEIVTRDDSELIAELCREINELMGRKPRTIEKGEIAIEVDHYQVDLLHGASFIFSIVKPDPKARYVWDASASGGKLDASLGARVVYTNEELGLRFKLKVQKMGDVKTARPVVITINALERLPLKFTTPSLTMNTNDKRTLRLVNVPKGASLDWSSTFTNNVKLTVSDDKTSAEAISGDFNEEGNVTVVDRNDRTQTAVANVVIKKGHSDGPERRRRADETEFEYEGLRFDVTSTKYEPGPECNKHTSWLEVSGTGLFVICLNFGHPLFRAAPPQIRLDRARQIICLRVAEAMNPAATPHHLHQAVALVAARLTPQKRDDD